MRLSGGGVLPCRSRHRLFEKTGTSRHADLVKLIAAIAVAPWRTIRKDRFGFAHSVPNQHTDRRAHDFET
jgi:hypothetical protein